MHSHPANQRMYDDQPKRSERIGVKAAAIMATGTFLLGQAVFITVWIVAARMGAPIDNSGLTILNLGLSLQASFAAPLILLATRRQTEHDRMRAEVDYRHGADSLALLHAIHTQLHGPDCRCWANPEGET